MTVTVQRMSNLIMILMNDYSMAEREKGAVNSVMT